MCLFEPNVATPLKDSVGTGYSGLRRFSNLGLGKLEYNVYLLKAGTLHVGLLLFPHPLPGTER